MNRELPQEFIDQLPSGVALAYSTIPAISALEEPLRSQVRKAFGDGFSEIWLVMTGISGIGLLSSLLMKALPLHTEVDDRRGIQKDATASTADIVLKDTSVQVVVETASVCSDLEDLGPELCVPL